MLLSCYCLLYLVDVCVCCLLFFMSYQNGHVKLLEQEIDVDSLALDLWPIQDTFRLCVGQDRPLYQAFLLHTS